MTRLSATSPTPPTPEPDALEKARAERATAILTDLLGRTFGDTAHRIVSDHLRQFERAIRAAAPAATGDRA